MRADNRCRNYRVTRLSPQGTVVVEYLHPSGARVESDTGLQPTEYGTWGLDADEVAIVRRGLARSGRDRRPQPDRA